MKNIFSIYLSCMLATTSFAQSGKTIDSEIKGVVVYQQGALVSREAKCSVQKGKTTFLIKGLSSKIDPAYLQVKTDNEQVTVVSVTHSIDFLNKGKTTKEIELLETKKKDIADSIQILKNLKAVYAQEKEMLIANKSIGGETGVNVNDLQTATNFFRTRLTEIESNTYQLERKSFRLKEKLVDVSKQLIELNAQIDIPSGQITIVLSANKTIETLLHLEYLISDAYWTPAYDVRIKDIDNPLVVVYKAKVNQNTGEDWKDVNLMLSTGNPSINNTKPNLDTYFLTFNNYYSTYRPALTGAKQIPNAISGKVTDAETGEALPGCSVSIKETNIATASDINGRFSLTSPSPYSIIQFSYVGYNSLDVPTNSSFANVKLSPSSLELNEVVVTSLNSISGKTAGVYTSSTSREMKKKEIIPLAIQKQQTSTEFKIDIPYSIPSDNKDYDVSMIQYEIPASYSYSAVPKLSNDVFLIAHLTDWAKYNLLEGDAKLFFKGTYQGDAFLDLKSFNDTLSLSVGRDKDIVIEREIQKDFTSRSFASGYKKESKGWNINIKNNKENAIKLMIEDQYPISKSDEIKVDLIEYSGAIEDKESGKLTWILSIAPKEKKNLLLKYSVKYPKDKKVLVE